MEDLYKMVNCVLIQDGLSGLEWCRRVEKANKLGKWGALVTNTLAKGAIKMANLRMEKANQVKKGLQGFCSL